MKLRMIVTALALSVAPVMALAGGMGCPHEALKSASQCPPGQTWNTAQQTCQVAVNS